MAQNNYLNQNYYSNYENIIIGFNPENESEHIVNTVTSSARESDYRFVYTSSEHREVLTSDFYRVHCKVQDYYRVSRRITAVYLNNRDPLHHRVVKFTNIYSYIKRVKVDVGKIFDFEYRSYLLSCPLLNIDGKILVAIQAIHHDLRTTVIYYTSSDMADDSVRGFFSYYWRKITDLIPDFCPVPDAYDAVDVVSIGRHYRRQRNSVDLISFDLYTKLGYNSYSREHISVKCLDKLKVRFAGADPDTGGEHFYGSMMNELNNERILLYSYPELVKHNTVLHYINLLRSMRVTARMSVAPKGVVKR